MKSFSDDAGNTWQYDEEARLGSGGFGSVFRGHGADSGVPVAVKVVSAGTDDPKSLQDREIEIGQLVAADPPSRYLVKNLGVGRVGQDILLVMPLADGTLADLLKSGVIDVADGIAVVREIALGLKELAAKSIQHRDLKPDNVLKIDGRWQLADFGIARNTAMATAVPTFKGWGTAAYMAPEVLEMKPATVKSDLYALGVIAFEIFTGRRPFEGTDEEIAIQHLTAAPPVELLEGLPAGLRRLILRLLKKHPSDRHEDARGVVAALDSVQRRLSPVQSALSAAATAAVERETKAEAERAAQFEADRRIQDLRRQGIADLGDILEEAEELAREGVEDVSLRADGRGSNWVFEWSVYQLAISAWPGRIAPTRTTFPLIGVGVYVFTSESRPDDNPAPIANLLYQHDGQSGTWYVRKWHFSGTTEAIGLGEADFWQRFEEEGSKGMRHYVADDNELTPDSVVELLIGAIR
ncbi:serine/threonine-protein kinase [Rhodococcus opacus]|uniref:serine/threonine-protein kinase n=1 Tax=Rhodococcus opacus TaxID=37919 RepID=UPI0006864B24|nr:serine/threonine-protein kinase [Rhodococcus opacus]